MISLFESILSSTKSGAYSIIKKWCQENLRSMKNGEDEHGWMIDGDMKITNWTNGKSTNALNVENSKTGPVPSYIKFAEELKGSFFVGQLLNWLKPEQLPKHVGLLYISGLTGKIPTFSMECKHGIYVIDKTEKLKHIDPIYIQSSTDGGQKPIYDFNDTQIDFESIQNIHVEGDIYKLGIKNTPAAEEIKKQIKKCKKADEKYGTNTLEEYLESVFGHLPGLRFIELSARTSIEHNPKDLKWYVF